MAAACFVAVGLVIAQGAIAPVAARDPGATTRIGSVTALALPRYASLKSDRVNVRKGPGRDYAIAWVFQRVGLPVEIIGEVEGWRQIRDSEGAEGWVFAGLLSGRRSGIVAPWDQRQTAMAPTSLNGLIQSTSRNGAPRTIDKSQLVPIIYTASRRGQRLALLEPGTIVSAQSCDGTWCLISIRRIEGYVDQKKLWGVYPDETFE